MFQGLLVAMVALVERLAAQEVGCWSRRGGAALALPGERGRVVRQCANGPVTDIAELGRDVVLCDGAGQLEVRVGDGPPRVVGGDDVGLDVGRKRGTPKDGLPGGTKDDAAHSGLGGITGAQDGGCLRDDFAEVRGTLGEVRRDVTDVIERIMHSVRQRDAASVRVAEGFLEEAEHSAQAWHGQFHAPELSHDLVPLFRGRAALSPGKLGEDGVESGLSSGGELDGVLDGVHGPPKDVFPGGPLGVPLP
jgi:hypothetical protein